MSTFKKMLAMLALLAAIMACAILGTGWGAQRSEQIWAAIDIVFLVVVSAIVLVAISFVVWFLFEALERIKLGRARTRQARAEALEAETTASFSVIRAQPGEQVYISEQQPRIWHAIHRDPRVYSNGVWSDPTPTEIASYLAYLEASSRRQLAPSSQSAGLLAEAGARPLLEILRDMERGLVVGPPGSGKTTVMQHIVDQRPGDIIVIDPHDDQSTWPAAAQVVGGGQDYRAIESTLAQVADLIRGRYRQRSTGEISEFSPVTLVLDEWFEVFEELNQASGYVKRILTGGRKVSTAVLIGSHSERVGPLGIKGAGDLKNAYTIIRLQGDRAHGISGTVDVGDGEIPVLLPGPYLPGVTRGQLQPGDRQWEVDPELQILQEREKFILERHAAGDTPSQIGTALYGQRGGWQTERVLEVLQKHNLEPNQ